MQFSKAMAGIPSSVSYPLSFQNVMLTGEWEVGLVDTSSVHPIAFYYQPSRTRWWGLVLFSFGTGLCVFLGSRLPPTPTFGCYVFLQKGWGGRMIPAPPLPPHPQPDLFKMLSSNKSCPSFSEGRLVPLPCPLPCAFDTSSRIL